MSGLGGLNQTPTLLIGEVQQDLANYQGSPAFDDDVTMLVARYLGADANAAANDDKA